MKLKNERTTIKIDDEYFLELDSYNFILKRKYFSEELNKELDTILGYFPSVALALEWLKKDKINNLSKEISLDEYISKLKELENWNTQIIKRERKLKHAIKI